MRLENNHRTAQPKKPKPNSTETRDRTKDKTLSGGGRGRGERGWEGEKKTNGSVFSPPRTEPNQTKIRVILKQKERKKIRRKPKEEKKKKKQNGRRGTLQQKALGIHQTKPTRVACREIFTFSQHASGPSYHDDEECKKLSNDITNGCIEATTMQASYVCGRP